MLGLEFHTPGLETSLSYSREKNIIPHDYAMHSFREVSFLLKLVVEWRKIDAVLILKMSSVLTNHAP